MATKWLFIMTQSYPATRKNYAVSWMLHGLRLASSGWGRMKKQPRQVNVFQGFLSDADSGI